MFVATTMFVTEYSIAPTDLARELEVRGFEALLLPEHTHIPVSRESPYPGGGDMPKEYAHTLDPFVALAAAASVTRSLKLGTGISLLVQRDPITTAKVVASLDHISGGRALLGVGAGWNLEEMRHHGTDPDRRWRLLRERVAAMRALWTQEQAEFHGEYVDFGPSWSWPKPMQVGGPPILLGGGGPKVIERAVDYADSWMPIGGRPGVDLGPRVKELRRLAAESGRSIGVTVVHAGQPTVEALAGYQELGAERVVLWLPTENHSSTASLLDSWQHLVDRFAS